jgi:malonyl-CoA O-methyltransferase
MEELLRKPKPSAILRLAGSPMPLGLQDSVVDLLWLNGILHWLSDWMGQLRELRRVARPGALLSFSLLGVDSFRQLRPVAPGLMRFPDMHDLGDALIRAGWAEPVVDMERIDLSWREVDRMLTDLRALGGNCLEGRFDGMRGRKWFASVLESLETLRNADGLLRVQLELILGHAWRAGDPGEAQAWKPVRVARRSSG